MTKVIAQIRGGLGNQLFIYAAARRLALMNNAELVLDDISGFIRDFQYRRYCQLNHFNILCRKATARERFEPFPRFRRSLKRRLNIIRPFEQRNYIQQEGVDFELRLLSLRPHGALYFEGYWQSEGYFYDVESQIREDLRITPPTDVDNLMMAANIQRTVSVAVHVRFFDEPEQIACLGRAVNNAPGDYYQRAVDEMEQRVPGAHYFLFSDHPEAARARIPLPEERITLIHHNQGDAMAYADLWLMTQCRHFIIANSTFSWWGAWLSDNPEPVVIAPGFEKRDGKMHWGFTGLLPDRWIQC